MKKDGKAETRKKRRRLRRKFFPRGLSFTREGRIFVIVTLGVGFAAVNTGNNLLFLMLGMMLGLIIVSGILSEATLRHIEVKRYLPRRVDAEKVFLVQLALSNKKWRAASYSIELRDEIDGVPFKRRCFFLRVAPQEKRSISYKCEIQRRGRAHFDGTIVSTRFPFGFFEKSRFFTLEDEIIVYPAIVPVNPKAWYEPASDGSNQQNVRGLGNEYLQLREMKEGDDPRRIDWRSTARTGRPFVKEADRDAAGFVEIVLDAAVRSGDEKETEEIERRIRVAGSLIRHYGKKDFRIRLVLSENRVFEKEGENGTRLLLEKLALLKTDELEAEGSPRHLTASHIRIAEQTDRFVGGTGEHPVRTIHREFLS